MSDDEKVIEKKSNENEKSAEESVEVEESRQESSDEEWIGPMPTEAVPAKKRKGILLVFLSTYCQTKTNHF